MTKESDSIEKCFKRYDKAVSDGEEMRALLSDAYYYAAPYRNDFFVQTAGTDEMGDVYDNTAVDGLVRYATNIQSIMMPPYQRFLNFIPGNKKIKEFKDDPDGLDKIKEQLQDITELFFTSLRNSNFFLASHEALQDMGISTGVLMINQGTIDDPFLITSVPLSQVYFGVNAKKEIVDFYRDWKLKVSDIEDEWPNATLPPTLVSKLKTEPQEEVELVESVILYPGNSPEYKYHHRVMTKNKEQIFEQFLNYCPFIAFRSNVSPNTFYGIGAILRLLPTIRLLNRILEDGVAILDWKAYPSWMLSSNAVINPYNIHIKANQTFPVRNTGEGDAIKLLQPNSGGSDTLFQAWVDALQKTIRDTLFLNPISDEPQNPQQTKFEVATRKQNWIRNGGSEYGRLNNELINPIARTGIQIMKNLGMIGAVQSANGNFEVELDGDIVTIDYASPLLALQNQEDIQAVNAFMQNWAGLFGVEFLPTIMDLSPIPGWMADKQNIPLQFLRKTSDIAKAIQNMAQQAQQQVNNANQAAQGAGAQQQGGGGAPQQLILPDQGSGQQQPDSSQLLS